MLTREEDYTHGRPSLTRKKLRRLEITAGAPRTPAGRLDLVDQRPDGTAKPNSHAKPRPPTSGWSDQLAGAAGKKAGANSTPEHA